jgi:hypothetical protein
MKVKEVKKEKVFCGRFHALLVVASMVAVGYLVFRAKGGMSVAVFVSALPVLVLYVGLPILILLSVLFVCVVVEGFGCVILSRQQEDRLVDKLMYFFPLGIKLFNKILEQSRRC